MIVSVIGLGEVGTPTFEDLTKKLGKTHQIIGVDINPKTIETFKAKGHTIVAQAPASDIYIIAVYLTKQVLDVLHKLDLSKKPLISIESTIALKDCPEFIAWAQQTGTDLITVPHRFNPNDPAHRVFNLNRVLGGATPNATKRGMEFYEPLMESPAKMHAAPDFTHAALSKLVDNSTRYAQIAWAQALRQTCEKHNIDFNAIRTLSGTKWNVTIMEARDGIKLKCLPKDMDLLREALPHALFDALVASNNDYKLYAEIKGFPKTPDL